MSQHDQMELQFISWHEWKWNWIDLCQVITGTQTAMKTGVVWKTKWHREGGGVREMNCRWGGGGCWPLFPLALVVCVNSLALSEEACRFLQRSQSAVEPGQMEEHMAAALLLRCSACCVSLNNAQVHSFKKALKRRYGNLVCMIICYCRIWDFNVCSLNFMAFPSVFVIWLFQQIV